LASAQRSFRFAIIVVDNAVVPTARGVVADSHVDVTYIHEPRPGIAAARNALLRAGGSYRAIIFVDDDEFVASDWFENLLSFANESGADVVLGPVIPLLPEGCREWIRRGKFFDRQRHLTGAVLDLAATNNVLVRTSTISLLGVPRFDEAFSVSGGSDTEFFGRLARRGASILWCDEAVVYEHVPAERARFKWIWRRQVRVGNVSGRLYLRKHSRIRIGLAGLLRIALGSIRTIAAIGRLRSPGHDDLGPIGRGVGLLRAMWGSRTREYVRER
jgi:GT2 family glycosyltransferase